MKDISWSADNITKTKMASLKKLRERHFIAFAAMVLSLYYQFTVTEYILIISFG